MSKHTATPWRLNSRHDIYSGSRFVGSTYPSQVEHIAEEDHANAQLIVRAVNAHAALLAASQSAKDELERLMAILGDEDYATAEAVVETLSEAIKLAEGEE